MMEGQEREQLLRGWEAMAPDFGCHDLLYRLDPLERCNLYNELAFSRLERKQKALMELFGEQDCNWPLALFRMVLRTVGDLQNREAYMELGRRLSYSCLLRERNSVVGVEALLFGTASLLEGCRDDEYTRLLRTEFEHLRHKYRIEPMDPARWRIHYLRPANHPRLRLAQIAALVMHPDFCVEKLIECRTVLDIERIFALEASQYWSSYYNPSSAVDHTTKRLGRDKAHSLGINLVAVLQFAYGRHMGRDELVQRALDLWESLPAEQNRYTRIWEYATPLNAFESQAQLELAREYCEKSLCRQCPLAKRRLRIVGNEQ